MDPNDETTPNARLIAAVQAYVQRQFDGWYKELRGTVKTFMGRVETQVRNVELRYEAQAGRTTELDSRLVQTERSLSDRLSNTERRLAEFQAIQQRCMILQAAVEALAEGDRAHAQEMMRNYPQ